MTEQILVTESAIPGALASAFRQILLVIGGWAVGKGWLDNDTLTALTTIVIIVAPLIYGQIKGLRTHRKLVAVAASPAVPDSVATFK